MIKFTKTVEVYNKNGVKIAVFGAPTDVNSPQTSKELMLDPIVEIEQNGSSTLEFSINVNSEKWNIIKDPENRYRTDGREYITLKDGAYTFNGDYVSVVCVESWYELGKKYVQAYNVNDTTLDPVDEHTVKLLPKSTGPLYVNGIRYNNNPYPRGSAGYNLWALLQGSGWTLGVCDVIVDGFSTADDFGVFNIETDMEPLLDNIENIQKLYGGVLVWDSVNKILNLRDEEKWNTDTGFEARVGKNIKDDIVIEQSNDIITRLYPLGRDYLNIKAVNNNKTYIDNFSYTNNIYSRILQNSDLYDQKQLKFWGELQLKKLCNPTRTVSVKIIDRRLEPGYETEEFDLNSIVTIYYTNPEGEQESEKQRIVKWRYHVFDPSNSEIECGNKSRNIEEILKQSYDMGENADSKFNSSGNISSGTIYVPESYGGSYGWGGGSLSGYLQKSEKQITLMVEHIDENHEALAGFIIYADKTYATVEALAKYRTETTESIANLKLYADKTFASAELFAKYQNDTNTSIAGLSTRVDGVSATASLVTSIVDNNGNIKAASIVQAVNASGSSIKISADHINIDGITTFIRKDGGSGATAYWSGRDFIWQMGSNSGGVFNVQGYLSTSAGLMSYGGIYVYSGSVYVNGGYGQSTSLNVTTSGILSKTLTFTNGILTAVS